MKREVEISQVISDLTELFKIEDYHKFRSFKTDNEFFINKQQIERFEVIDMLQKYFNDKVIKGGYLIVDPITFVFTTFKVLEGKPNNQ